MISFDGDENSHSYRVDYSGENSYNQVMRNVKLLQKKFPDYFENSVSFISVLHDRNDVEPLLSFFKTTFNKAPHISTLSTSGVNEAKKEEFKKMFQNKTTSINKSQNCESLEASPKRQSMVSMPNSSMYRCIRSMRSAVDELPNFGIMVYKMGMARP